MANNRTLGESFGVSIATALPFEEKILVAKPGTQHLWINLYTLYRNFYESYDDISGVSVGAQIELFIEELNMIKSIANGMVKVHLFCPELGALQSVFRYALLWTPTTERQHTYRGLEYAVLKAIGEDKSLEINHIKVKLPDQSHSAWILTHHPVDLLSRYSFSDLKLLESHTGAIKESHEWGTKLTGHDKWPHMPFNALTLQIFGDRSTLFRSMGAKLKKPMLETAIAGRWTPATSKAKILFDLDKLKDRYASKVLKEMMSVNLK